MMDASSATESAKHSSHKFGPALQHFCSNGSIHHTFDNSRRDEVDILRFREQLLKNEPEASILQVVGDSGTSFDESSLNRARQILSDAIDERTFIEYGWTYQTRDANWLVVDYLEIHPEAGARTIGNVVDASHEALKCGWARSEKTQQLVIVHDDPPTTFGDDLWISDGIMRPGDRMICFEGGIQSLKQCTNMLLAGIGVTVVTDLRPATKFSAARFLMDLKENRQVAEDENLEIQEQIDRLFNGQVDLNLITIA